MTLTRPPPRASRGSTRQAPEGRFRDEYPASVSRRFRRSRAGARGGVPVHAAVVMARAAARPESPTGKSFKDKDCIDCQGQPQRRRFGQNLLPRRAPRASSDRNCWRRSATAARSSAPATSLKRKSTSRRTSTSNTIASNEGCVPGNEPGCAEATALGANDHDPGAARSVGAQLPRRRADASWSRN